MLVAIQVDQNTEIARAQLVSADWMNSMETQHVLMGKRPAEAWAKAVNESQPLTDEDIYLLNAMLNAHWSEAARIEQLAEEGFEVFSPELMGIWFSIYLGNDFGASWWDANKDNSEHMPRTTAAVKGALAARPDNRNWNLSYLTRLRDGMNPETQQ